MRTVATFRASSFNLSEPKDYFINPGCFGDDVATWLMQRLQERGIETADAPGQEDFGWYFDFETPDGKHCCVIGGRPPEGEMDGEWVVWIERSAGLIGSLLGRRKHVSALAVQSVHDVLTQAPEVESLRWHEKRRFDCGQDQDGHTSPTS